MIGRPPKWMESDNIIVVVDDGHNRPDMMRLALKGNATGLEKEEFEKEMNRLFKPVSGMLYPEMKNPRYLWTGEVVDDNSVDRYRERRDARLDARLDEEGRWVTTEEKHHVHINEEGVPDKGNPYVLKTMRGEGPNPKTREQIVRERSQRRIKKVRDALKQYDDMGKEIEDAKKKLWEVERETIYVRGMAERQKTAKKRLSDLGYGPGDDKKMERDIEECKRKTRELINAEKENWEENLAELDKLDERRKAIESSLKYDYPDAYGENRERISAAELKEANDRVAACKKRVSDLEKKREVSKKHAITEDVGKVRLYTPQERADVSEKVKKSEMWGDMGPEARDKMMEAVDGASDVELSILEKTADKARINKSYGRSRTGANSWYTFGTGAISLSEEDMDDPRVGWHEYGHFLDDQRSSGCGCGTWYIGDSEFQHTLSDVIYDREVLHGKEARADLERLLNSTGPNKEGETIKYEVTGDGMFSVLNAETGEVLPDFVVSEAVFQKFQEFFSDDPEYYSYMKGIGWPGKDGLDTEPKWGDYYEEYVTPKRQIRRTREKYKGAEEEYAVAMRRYWEEIDRVTAEHPELLDRQRAHSERYEERREMITGVSDIMSGIMFGRGFWIYGAHSESYYQGDARNPSKEAVANYHQMRVMGQGDALKFFEKMMPSVAKGLKSAYDEWLWRNV